MARLSLSLCLLAYPLNEQIYNTRPMSWEQITAKFESLASPFTTAAQRSAIIDLVAQLETKEVAQLTEALNAPFLGSRN